MITIRYHSYIIIICEGRPVRRVIQRMHVGYFYISGHISHPNCITLSHAAYHIIIWLNVSGYQSCTEFNGNVISPHHATVLFHA